jgi:hypothetical protein
MEIVIFGKQAEAEEDISKNDDHVIKYTVFVNTKFVPDGFGCTKFDSMFFKNDSILKKHSRKLTTKQYLDEYL